MKISMRDVCLLLMGLLLSTLGIKKGLRLWRSVWGLPGRQRSSISRNKCGVKRRRLFEIVGTRWNKNRTFTNTLARFQNKIKKRNINKIKDQKKTIPIIHRDKKINCTDSNLPLNPISKAHQHPRTQAHHGHCQL